MSNLIGLHDREGIVVSVQDTWILDTIALSENPSPFVYGSNWHWICRVNWGYGSTGTIPLPEQDDLFLSRLSSYVAKSSGCSRWVIGNEPNLSREWPQNQPIHPSRYAEFYRKCRKKIKALPGHEKDEVLIAASGPWNDEYKYAGNSSGDWIRYFTDTISFIPEDEIDGFSIHAYTHGYDMSLVMSEARMDPPFQNRYYNFRTYRDYCLSITENLAHLPIYLTEANGNGEWKAVGLMPEMAREIDSWNKSSVGRKIKCLIFYRYPKYDQYHIVEKPDVVQEYKNTTGLGFQSPSLPKKIFIPEVIKENLMPGAPEATVKAGTLNVRNRPGVKNTEVVGLKHLGDRVSILEEVYLDGSLWYRIGENQWISGNWVEGKKSPDIRSNWDRVKEFTGGWEGGFQNFDWDPGNWTGCVPGKGVNKGTNFGISACSYPNLDIRNITKQQAEEIYFRDYWQRSGASELSWPMCLLVYDTAVNFGSTTAAIWLKESKGNMLKFCALRLRGYRKSRAWPQAGNAWVDRTIDLMLEASE